MRGGNIQERVTSLRFPVTVTSSAGVSASQGRCASGASQNRQGVVHDIYLRILLTGLILSDNLIEYADSYGGSTTSGTVCHRRGKETITLYGGYYYG